MDSEVVAAMAGAAAGLAGAGVGGLITLFVNRNTLRAQQVQAIQLRRQLIQDRQLETHLAFLNRGSFFHDRTRDLMRAWRNGSPLEEQERAWRIMDEAWHNYSDRAGAAQLTGPPTLKKLVNATVQHVIKTHFANA